MKLSCIRTGGDVEHDADYETAIDLRHYTIETEQALYELASGARLLFERVTITTTGTYLEPDFDHFEATGRTVYVEHDDELFGVTLNSRACLYGLVPVRHACLDDGCDSSSFSDGWEAVISFAPGEIASIEDWGEGKVTSLPDQVCASLNQAYELRVEENWQAFLDGLATAALLRLDIAIARAYQTLGISSSASSAQELPCD